MKSEFERPVRLYTDFASQLVPVHTYCKMSAKCTSVQFVKYKKNCCQHNVIDLVLIIKDEEKDADRHNMDELDNGHKTLNNLQVMSDEDSSLTTIFNDKC